MRAAARAYTGDKQVTELSLPFGVDTDLHGSQNE